MTRLYSIFALLLLIPFYSFSQKMCGGNGGGDNFSTACMICNTGFVGNTAGFIADNFGVNFPCGTLDNTQWASFIADASTVSAQISAFNCTGAIGVEFAIYDQGLSLVSNCFSSGGSTLSGTVTANNLTAGNKYYLLIDGFNGSSCGFSVRISGNLEMQPPVEPVTVESSSLNPSGVFCVGEEVCFEVDDVPFATSYEWHVSKNAKVINHSNTTKNFCVRWKEAGGGLVRVTPSNPCYSGLPNYSVNIVSEIPKTIKPPENVCSGNLPVVIDGITFDDFGIQEVNLGSVNGCDSIVVYDIVEVIDSALAAPIISCDPGDSTILFTWNDDPDADNYIPTVLTGQSGVRINRLNFEATVLGFGEEVTLQVTAEDFGNFCFPSTSSKLTCQTNNIKAAPTKNNPKFGNNGLTGIKTKSLVLIHPNPTNETVNISASSDIEQVDIFNVSGKRIKSIYQEKSIDCSDLSSGIYFFKIKIENEIYVERIQKI